jgi:hypothetical protein
MDVAEENIVNAGILFMFSVWLQGQMSDLIILRRNPHLVEPFVASPQRVPKDFHTCRADYWEKQFGAVKAEFLSVFSGDITEPEKQDLDQLYHTRNMIAHAHVSIGRSYMLYRPQGGESREQKLIEAFRIQSIEDQSEPLMLKLEFWKHDLFKELSDLVERFDQVTLKRLADNLGVPHGRIR